MLTFLNNITLNSISVLNRQLPSDRKNLFFQTKSKEFVVRWTSIVEAEGRVDGKRKEKKKQKQKHKQNRNRNREEKKKTETCYRRRRRRKLQQLLMT